ncbi:MAG: hypothetical protein R3F50_18365 [Gammaproteobacteria bacterium]
MEHNKFERYLDVLKLLSCRVVGQRQAKMAIAEGLSPHKIQKIPAPIIAAIGRYGHGKLTVLRMLTQYLYGNDIAIYNGIGIDRLSDRYFTEVSHDSLFYRPLYGENTLRTLELLNAETKKLRELGEFRRGFFIQVNLSSDLYRFDDHDPTEVLINAAMSEPPKQMTPEIVRAVIEMADVVLPFECLSEQELHELVRVSLNNKLFRHQAYAASKFGNPSPASVQFSDEVVSWLLSEIVEKEGSYPSGNAIQQGVEEIFSDNDLYDQIMNARADLLVDLKGGTIVVTKIGKRGVAPFWL